MTQRTSHQARHKGRELRPGWSGLRLQRNRAIAGEPAAIPVPPEGGVAG